MLPGSFAKYSGFAKGPKGTQDSIRCSSELVKQWFALQFLSMAFQDPYSTSQTRERSPSWMKLGGLLPVYLGMLLDPLPMILRRKERPKRQEQRRALLPNTSKMDASPTWTVRLPQIVSNMRILCGGGTGGSIAKTTRQMCFCERLGGPKCRFQTEQQVRADGSQLTCSLTTTSAPN